MHFASVPVYLLYGSTQNSPLVTHIGAAMKLRYILKVLIVTVIIGSAANRDLLPSSDCVLGTFS